jgi:hypothetical protein
MLSSDSIITFSSQSVTFEWSNAFVGIYSYARNWTRKYAWNGSNWPSLYSMVCLPSLCMVYNFI